jgi:Heterokaryon incompatibility protein (HET)
LDAFLSELHSECNSFFTGASGAYLSSCNLILVDVIDKKLILGQPSLERRYIALSYVWGGVSTLRATTKNLDALQQSGALSAGIGMPRTVRDSMTLVRSLGERYLWVDCLCIIQDDEENKAFYVAQMDIVYHHAYLTIVAIGGPDANAGLPGIRPFTRAPPSFAEVGENVLVATAPSLRGSVDTSRYDERGWTLQERILSRRCVYFSQQEVYFQCKSAVWHETSLVRHLFGKGRVFESPSMMNPIKTAPDGSLRDPETAYQSLVENYSRRSLTYPSDKLRAFLGMLNLFRGKDPQPWINTGVPSRFWNSLLWAPLDGTTLTRRLFNDPTQNAPSWSWLGWDGPIDFPVREKVFGHPQISAEQTPLEMLACNHSTAPGPHNLSFRPRIRVPTNLSIQNGQIKDVNHELVPGTFLRHKVGIECDICGVLYDFEYKFSDLWRRPELGLVFHSYAGDDTEPGVHDGPPQLKFRLGHYTRVMEKSELHGTPDLVNALVVCGVTGTTGNQLFSREGMVQILKSTWKELEQQERQERLGRLEKLKRLGRHERQARMEKLKRRERQEWLEKEEDLGWWLNDLDLDNLDLEELEYLESLADVDSLETLTYVV